MNSHTENNTDNERTDKKRWFALYTLALGLAAVALLLHNDSHTLLIASVLVVYGLGLGLASAQLTSTVLRDVPTAESGQGSATQSTVRQVGAAVGAAVSGAVRPADLGAL